MIAFRRAHTTVSRFGYWRDDVRWFGPKGDVDFDSQSLAYLLYGDAESGGTLYVMIHGSDEPEEFIVQHEDQFDWRQLVDTSRADAFSLGAVDTATEAAAHWVVEPRSILVLGSTLLKGDASA